MEFVSRSVKKRGLIILIPLLLCTSTKAFDQKVTKCKQFLHNSALFKKCWQKYNIVPENLNQLSQPKKINEQSCSICDVRQKNRVKQLLEKKKSEP